MSWPYLRCTVRLWLSEKKRIRSLHVEEKNKEDENEEDMVPSFAGTYEAL
jgi:hypothetical protein